MHIEFFVLFFGTLLAYFVTADIQVGVGIHDATGPLGGVNFMGYAMPQQITQGIHMRLRSRAFIFESNGIRVVYCSVDVPMLSPNVKRGIIEMLQRDFGDMYSQQNVMISTTHTHAGPGGYHDYLVYDITSLGHIHESAEMMVSGIYKSIVRAHRSVRPTRLFLQQGRLANANINRSPTSYLANPADERALYEEEGDTDKTMTLLKLVDMVSGKDRAWINWFSVHCTSMNNTNRLVSGDNKGYASYLAELTMNRDTHGLGSGEYLPYSSSEWTQKADRGDLFVAAFSQSNEGDVSPNTQGAFCLNSGEPCDLAHSTCKDRQGRQRNEFCHARGPGWQRGDAESTRVIGLRQYLTAKRLFDEAETPLQGEYVQFAHAWVDMSNTTVRLANGSLRNTCPPARGFSFAAGTTDGPGAFDFYQGDNTTGNPLWNFVRSFISKPSPSQKACHWPKPILLNTGEISLPYPWEPKVIDIQILRVGELVILGVPAEFTTMAGRRLRRAIHSIFTQTGFFTETEGTVVIAGLSNSYSGYVTTFEEYQAQRYEGASTIFGPHTLSAYIQEFSRLAYNMISERGGTHQPIPKLPSPAHPSRVPPTDFSNRLISLLPPVLFDAVPPRKQFGERVDTLPDVKQMYRVGETAEVTFYAGHPRNLAHDPSTQLERTVMTVEKYVGPNTHELKQMLSNWLRKEGHLKSGRFTASVSAPVSSTELHFSISAVLPTFLRFQGMVTDDESFGEVLINVTMSFREQKPELRLSPDLETPAAETPVSIVTSSPLWKIIRDDNDWDTRFHWWKPTTGISAVSYARLEWDIGRLPTQADGLLDTNAESLMVDEMTGSFRLHYYGADKTPAGHIRMHEGVSSVFGVGKPNFVSTFDFEV